MNDALSRLATIIEQKSNYLIDRWRAGVANLPRARRLEGPVLVDHIPQLLSELSAALTHAQTLSLIELRGHKTPVEHGASRFQLGFDVEEVVAEFNLLREILQEFAEENGINISGEVNYTINRLVDKAIAGSLETYLRLQSEEEERQRRQHLAFIVHDLKTPITAIATGIHVIEERIHSGKGQPSFTGLFHLIRRNADRLNQLVMEIINRESRLYALTTNAPQLQLDIREIDLWPFAERLKQECQTIADSKNTKIRNEVPHNLRIRADSDLLMGLLQNLLSNALKHTQNGEVRIGAADQSDSVVFWVRDTGAGIPRERLERILDKRPSDPVVPRSSGLGLAIVQRTVDLHGGTISVDSTVGHGSTFWVKFPRKAAA
jgi:signal transduction histidine kinase